MSSDEQRTVIKEYKRKRKGGKRKSFTVREHSRRSAEQAPEYGGRSVYLSFQIVERKPKTNVYSVVSRTCGDKLGSIFWYGPWRQYVFEPSPETVWSRGCLAEIAIVQNTLLPPASVVEST